MLDRSRGLNHDSHGSTYRYVATRSATVPSRFPFAFDLPLLPPRSLSSSSSSPSSSSSLPRPINHRSAPTIEFTIPHVPRFLERRATTSQSAALFLKSHQATSTMVLLRCWLHGPTYACAWIHGSSRLGPFSLHREGLGRESRARS